MRFVISLDGWIVNLRIRDKPNLGIGIPNLPLNPGISGLEMLQSRDPGINPGIFSKCYNGPQNETYTWYVRVLICFGVQ